MKWMSKPLPVLVLALLVAHAVPADARNKTIGQAIQDEVSDVLQAHDSTTFAAHGSVEVAFSPNGGCTAATVRFIGEAKQSIRMAAYGLTSNPIGKALVEAKKRGVDVRVVVDREHNGRRNTPNSIASFLASNGVPVRVDSAVKIQHNKVVIVDGKSVQNGSFNFTAAAQTSNAENIIIHRDFPELAGLFTRNWNHLWSESEDHQASY
jgi:phosphatidylserine/phosphatidylglycerophosphate/cardiolipin synthase-like enzyme